MLHLIPGQLPSWRTLLADLGDPPSEDVGRVLGYSAQTVGRWRRDDAAPRCAALALFWLTRWGRSAVDCQAVNDARQAWGMVGCLQRENAMLRARIARLEAIGEFGAANAPYLDPIPSPSRIREAPARS